MVPFEENSIGLVIPQRAHDQEWERKQRNKEYRVAARREKRNRKGDEKKQRKLNATILRRMTRNPEKYSKNAERNRLRDITLERRRIWQEAVYQAQRLAAIHDPSGQKFNVEPVLLQEDGTVISQATLRRREERAQAKEAAKQAVDPRPPVDLANVPNPDLKPASILTLNDEYCQGQRSKYETAPQRPVRLSKSQLKKRAALEPRPPPPRPIIPDGISIPEGEENWIALWDLSDDQLERRVIRARKHKAAERKALRIRQQSGKAERRIARDEKRKVYRDIKLTWRSIKEEQVREKTKLKSMEDEESKKIAVDVNVMERKAALDYCANLGFTLFNTPGLDEIRPRVLGMKGVEVDFDAIELGEGRSDVKVKQNKKRVDLGEIPNEGKVEFIPPRNRDGDEKIEDFIKLDVGEGHAYESINLNNKNRRKLRRAIESAEIQKEMLVRQRALDHHQEKDIEAPPILRTASKPVNIKGSRILENGTLETAKQERLQARVDLAEFNAQMRILRKQAKEAAIYAGLQKHAELMGRIPANESNDTKQEDMDFSQTCANDTMEWVKDSVTPAPSIKGNASHKRDWAEAYDSSTDNDSLSESTGETLSASEEDLHYCKSFDNPGTKNRSSDRVTSSDCDGSSSYEAGEKVDGKLRNKAVKSADPISVWNTGALIGDAKRKGKFLRLLGAEKLSTKANGGYGNPGARSGPLIESNAHVNAALERQFTNGIAYKQAAVSKGLGA